MACRLQAEQVRIIGDGVSKQPGRFLVGTGGLIHLRDLAAVIQLGRAAKITNASGSQLNETVVQQ